MHHTSAPILVTGATGTVGASLLTELARRDARVRGVSREPGSARRAHPEVEWVAFDFERPHTFAEALRGVERVFLVARPGDEEPERTAAPFVQAMAESGVRHVVTLSAMGAERRHDVSIGRMEQAVEEAGLSWTHLRPNWFMQVFVAPPLGPAIREAGRIEVPAGDAPISWIDARDVAAVAATALTERGHEGRAYLLTGGEALDHQAVAATLSAVTGRSVTYRALSEAEGRRAVRAAGLGGRRAERLTRFYRLVRAGACAPVSTHVGDLLGRPPVTFERFAREHRACWTAQASLRPAPRSRTDPSERASARQDLEHHRTREVS